MKKIIEAFKFDFSERKSSEAKLNSLFKKYGFPNLYVSLVNDYDGYWDVINKRTQKTIFSAYHSAFVLFKKNESNGDVEVVFAYDIEYDENKCVVFNDKVKIEDDDELQKD